MAQKNNYLEGVIPFFYRRQIIDVMIHTFITAYQTAFPSITKTEAAEAFMRKYNITADLYDVKSIITAYDRTNKDLIDASKKEYKEH